jgi:hypothetical protein
MPFIPFSISQAAEAHAFIRFSSSSENISNADTVASMIARVSEKAAS